MSKPYPTNPRALINQDDRCLWRKLDFELPVGEDMEVPEPARQTMIPLHHYSLATYPDQPLMALMLRGKRIQNPLAGEADAMKGPLPENYRP